MKRAVKVLMNRDEMTEQEAMAEIKSFVEWAEKHALQNGNLWELEEEFMDRFGLEPDFLELPSDFTFGAEIAEREDFEDNMTDVEADADTLASAGWGTDEDYGYYGEDGY